MRTLMQQQEADWIPSTRSAGFRPSSQMAIIAQAQTEAIRASVFCEDAPVRDGKIQTELRHLLGGEPVAIKFIAHENELLLCYKPAHSFDSVYAKLCINFDDLGNLVRHTPETLPAKLKQMRSSLQDDASVRIKKVFTFTQDDLIGEMCDSETLVFRFASPDAGNPGHLRARGRVFGCEQDILLANNLRIGWKLFCVGCEYRTSVIKESPRSPTIGDPHHYRRRRRKSNPGRGLRRAPERLSHHNNPRAPRRGSYSKLYPGLLIPEKRITGLCIENHWSTSERKLILSSEAQRSTHAGPQRCMKRSIAHAAL